MSATVDTFVDALVDGDRTRVDEIVAEHGELDSRELYRRLLVPALGEVGRRWERDAISVAQEHLASAIVEDLLARDYPRVFHAPRNSRAPVLAATVQDERHVLGLRMGANLLEGAGFRVVFLGADVPHRALAGAATRHGARAVVLAAHGDARRGDLADAVRELRAGWSDRAPILAGGAAVTGVAEVEHVTAVDEVVDVVAALEAALGSG